MKHTEQYGLNQWDLSDRIQMKDFNADNVRLEAALTGLSGQIAGLDGRIGELPTGGDLTALETALRKADTSLSNSKLGAAATYFSDDNGFKLTSNGSHYALDISQLDLSKYAAFCLKIYLRSANNVSYYLNPIISSGIYKGKCISTSGTQNNAMAILPSPDTTTVFFFPLCSTSGTVGGFFLSEMSGIGSAACSYSQLEGFSLSPASGTTDPSLKLIVSMFAIKK